MSSATTWAASRFSRSTSSELFRDRVGSMVAGLDADVEREMKD